MYDNCLCSQLANKLNNAVEALGRPPLPVYVQVNTSGEDTKYGIEPSEVTNLAQHIKDSCKHLKFAGLMTIGQPDYSSKPENFEVFFSLCIKLCTWQKSDLIIEHMSCSRPGMIVWTSSIARHTEAAYLPGVHVARWHTSWDLPLRVQVRGLSPPE